MWPCTRCAKTGIEPDSIIEERKIEHNVTNAKSEENSETVIKLLKGIKETQSNHGVKLDDIKSDTELIKEYTSQIEEIFVKTKDLEGFLKQHLASDFEKLKFAWHDYKSGNISMKGLIKEGIKICGYRFVKKIIPI